MNPYQLDWTIDWPLRYEQRRSNEEKWKSSMVTSFKYQQWNQWSTPYNTRTSSTPDTLSCSIACSWHDFYFTCMFSHSFSLSLSLWMGTSSSSRIELTVHLDVHMKNCRSLSKTISLSCFDWVTISPRTHDVDTIDHRCADEKSWQQ